MPSLSGVKTVKCLILAAGQGLRIQPQWESKPLVPLAGKPLIERVITSALEGGVDEFVAVTGYHGPRVRAYVDKVAGRLNVEVTHVVNENWQLPNGLSVLAARDVMVEPFLLLMCDHVFDPGIITDLLGQPINEGEAILAVDYNTVNPLIDLEDVTRVLVENQAIQHIGKGIEVYNAFDTGIFYCTPGLFEAIESSIAMTGDASLSGGMNVLARRDRARTFDIGDRFWLDIDEPSTIDLAESLLTRLPVAP